MSIENLKDEYYEKENLIQLWIDYNNCRNAILRLVEGLEQKIDKIKIHKHYNLLSQEEKDNVDDILEKVRAIVI